MLKNYFFLGLVLMVSLKTMAQDQKWSVEASYPLVTERDEYGGNSMNGIIDVGIKYSFVDLRIVKIGAGINAGWTSISEYTDQDLQVKE